MVSAVNNGGGQGLQDVFDEAQEHNAHAAIKQASDVDVLRLKERKQFDADQQHNGERVYKSAMI